MNKNTLKLILIVGQRGPLAALKWAIEMAAKAHTPDIAEKSIAPISLILSTVGFPPNGIPHNYESDPMLMAAAAILNTYINDDLKLGFYEAFGEENIMDTIIGIQEANAQLRDEQFSQVTHSMQIFGNKTIDDAGMKYAELDRNNSGDLATMENQSGGVGSIVGNPQGFVDGNQQSQ